ncbi:MAG TPA: glycosyl hydrolase family 28 protein [Fimbriimonas sp.]
MAAAAESFPPPVAPSPHYRLWIDGEEVFVYETFSGSFGIASLERAATVEVEAAEPFESVVVRPLRREVQPTQQGRRVTFPIEGPGQMSIEFDGRFQRPFFLFAMPLEADRPSPDDPNVRFFGAGEVHAPGVVELRSGQTLYLEAGAVVDGIVVAEDAENIRICGRGILTGRSFHRIEPGQRKPAMINLAGCRNVRIEGITVVDGPTWHVVPNGCDNVLIDGINVVTGVVTGDGIDLVGCKNAVVQNCFVRSDDDCVAVKAVDYFSPKGLRDIEKIDVRSCVFWNGVPGNAIEIGFETRCDSIRNVRFRNLDILHSEFEGKSEGGDVQGAYMSGAAISIHNGDRAVIEDVLYEDIRVEDAREKLVDIKVLNARYSRDQQKGRVRNVTLRNIQVVGGWFPPSIIRGHPQENGEDVYIENVRFEGCCALGKPIASFQDARLIAELAKGITFEA